MIVPICALPSKTADTMICCYSVYLECSSKINGMNLSIIMVYSTVYSWIRIDNYSLCFNKVERLCEILYFFVWRQTSCQLHRNGFWLSLCILLSFRLSTNQPIIGLKSYLCQICHHFFLFIKRLSLDRR